jgi:predicted ABC-type transport system involved in lysophospholipase L1 biosynthesis ATPase subunit
VLTLVLDDEPTGNLDEGTRDEIIRLLEKLPAERGLTIVLVTQDSTMPAGPAGGGDEPGGRLALA